MAKKKTADNDTLSTDKVIYAVQVAEDKIISVEAASAEEAVNKAKGKNK